RTHARREHERTDLDAMPIARVTEVHGLYCTIETPASETPAGKTPAGKLLAIVPKTLQRILATRIVVGDSVRYSASTAPEPGAPQATVEAMLERKTILCRADSFKAQRAWPIVANADQMLIVASVVKPRIKWGLIDRMIVAAQSGNLAPIICLNKVDLASDENPRESIAEARERLAFYKTIGVENFETSVINRTGLDALRAKLSNKITVLAGHSGVGKSSLINSICPSIDLKVGEVSIVTDKGRHTTTSARIYKLDDDAGEVIDTPGVKLFGLWNINRAKLDELFEDVIDETAPDWRVESYERIVASLKG
ncbi:MAG TPA: ribosome small subunit-dependent GTPase A, partial [Tepidisphaeraceae bacterium]|nr:ribosome small subunit-dependent GTPase A [Tepidisphaeraceae bacterium]